MSSCGTFVFCESETRLQALRAKDTCLCCTGNYLCPFSLSGLLDCHHSCFWEALILLLLFSPLHLPCCSFQQDVQVSPAQGSGLRESRNHVPLVIAPAEEAIPR